MKTKSIKSLAALLCVAATLNLSALAGPGPQPVPSPLRAEQKNVSVASTEARKVPTIALNLTKTSAKLSSVSGPHGTEYFYRR